MERFVDKSAIMTIRMLLLFAVLCVSVYQSKADPYPIEFDDGPGLGRQFFGIGGLSGGGATSKLLVNYPEKLRDQILDYLFKPNFGAALQMLKVEIGGDIQSTDGTEASHMHNKWEENYQRGYEWWLMKEAKKRNSNIKLYGLPWGFPGWIGEGTNNPYVNNTQTADYVVRWVNAAKQVHGLTIDYLGLHNEGSWTPGYAKELRRVLDVRGFSHTRILAADGCGYSWSPATKRMQDPEFAKAVDFVGAHYTGSYSSPAAKASGVPLWSSEDWSTFNDEVGGGCWARLLNQNYVNGLMTSTISWNLIASYYENLPYYRTGLMTAAEPWSGYYEVNTPIWVTAHTTQFTEPGWFYLKHGSGVGRLPLGGSYVAFTAQNYSPYGKKGLTIVFETMTRNHSICKRPHLPDYKVETQQITVVLKGMFASLKELMVWKSVIGFDGAASRMFIQQDNVTVTDGKVTVGLGLDEVLTLTTVNTGFKGQYPDPPASKSFVLPYSDDFEGYNLYEEPYNLAQQTGSFEVLSASNNKFIRQMVLEEPVHWCAADTAMRAINVIGTNWTSVFVEVDFNISPINGSTGAFIAARVDTGGCGANKAQGVYLFALPDKYILSYALNRTSSVITQGPLSFKAGEWHKLSLFVQKDNVQGAFDGKGIINMTVTKGPTAGFAAIGTDSYGLADFDNLKLDTKPNGQKIMQEYFKST